MMRYSLALLLAIPACGLAQGPQQKSGAWERLTVVRTSPSGDDSRSFGAALPVGNGRLGAKLTGPPGQTTLWLNDTTFWSGSGPEHFEEAKRQEALKQTRAALAAGDFRKADAAARGLQARNNESYEPLGSLRLTMPGQESFSDYREALDISSGLLNVRYRVGGTTYTREIFASWPAQVLVLRMTADHPGALSFSASLETQMKNGARRVSAAQMLVTGRAPAHVDNYSNKGIVEWDARRGMGMEEALHIAVEGGTVTAEGDGLKVTAADAVTLILSAATSFNGIGKDPAREGKDAASIAEGLLAKASAARYEDLKAAHVADFQSLFRRLWISVNDEAPNRVAMAYQWARYVLLASSREAPFANGSAPRNEQGIWNRDVTPNYASDFTLNENPEKYYALAEPANLGEVTLPLIHFVGDLAANGARTAQVDYGFRGWVAHHNADLWAMTTMATGDPAWADWPMGGIWLCENVWDRFAFSGDTAYLARVYPILKGAAEFALDLLVDDGKGNLVTSPSTSPENHFKDPHTGERVAVSRGSTMDLALIRSLFEHTRRAAEVLSVDAPLRTSLSAATARLLPFQVGARGQLQEWSQDFDEWEPTHRHASHLVAVWPLSQITAAQPALYAAARRSLELRGPGGYHPDKAGMWARLGDGDKALESFRSLSFPSMYDAPMGAVAEMLLQSQTGVLNVLPALPSTWERGEVLGLRARGGYEVDIHWERHEVAEVTVRTFGGKTPEIAIHGIPVASHDPRVHIVAR